MQSSWRLALHFQLLLAKPPKSSRSQQWPDRFILGEEEKNYFDMYFFHLQPRWLPLASTGNPGSFKPFPVQFLFQVSEFYSLGQNCS